MRYRHDGSVTAPPALRCRGLRRRRCEQSHRRNPRPTTGNEAAGGRARVPRCAILEPKEASMGAVARAAGSSPSERQATAGPRPGSRPAPSVYRLVPTDPSDPEWRASAHRGAVVVRAGGEDRARGLAAAAFARPVARHEGEVRLASPWRQPYAVRAEAFEDPRYPAEGPEGVLEPAPPARPALVPASDSGRQAARSVPSG